MHKIDLLRAFMVVTYCNKLFFTAADRHNVILMSVLLLVAETIFLDYVVLKLRFRCFVLKTRDSLPEEF